MILLHRLSYYLYRQQNADVSRIKIITPNELMNLYLNELSEKLSVHKIQKLSISKYYLNLLSSYDEERWGKEIKFKTDYKIDSKFLEVIYSDITFHQIQNAYLSLKEKILQELHVDELVALFKKQTGKRISMNPASLSKVLESVKSLAGTIQSIDSENTQTMLNTYKDLNSKILYAKEKNLPPSHNMVKEIEKLQADIKSLDQRILSKEEVELISKITFSKFTVQFLYNSVVLPLLSEYSSQYGITRNHTGYHRYQLYLYLLIYALFQGELQQPDRFLHIDEGQDIAPNEYKLIKMVNGNSVTMNIYGDNNQLINQGVGISDWGQLSEISSTVYHLKENYRNTVEVTGYCADQLDIKTLAIGVSGSDVSEITYAEAITELISMKPSDQRVALIVKDYSMIEKDIDSFRGVKSELVKGKVSVMSVADAKGLEFEKVYVVVKDMTKNERYIAFTRALTELSVVSI